jgi:hypothetical protein
VFAWVLSFFAGPASGITILYKSPCDFVDVIDELRKGASGEWRFISRHIRCEMALALQHP